MSSQGRSWHHLAARPEVKGFCWQLVFPWLLDCKQQALPIIPQEEFDWDGLVLGKLLLNFHFWFLPCRILQKFFKHDVDLSCIQALEDQHVASQNVNLLLLINPLLSGLGFWDLWTCKCYPQNTSPDSIFQTWPSLWKICPNNISDSLDTSPNKYICFYTWCVKTKHLNFSQWPPLRLLIMSPLNFFFGHGDAEKTGDNLSRIAMGNVPRPRWLESLSECCVSVSNIN